MRALIIAACLAAAPALALPADVTATPSGIGTVFTTKAGMTLYTYDKDVQRDVSACIAACAKAWPPLLAADDAKPDGEWSLATRDDGKKQWSFRGKPLYLYARDAAPGTTLGDGFQDIWHVAVDLAPRPKGVKFQGTKVGRVAATSKGYTLYAVDKDCNGACLANWTPFRAAWSANTTGDWSVVARKDDGTPQWAFRGKAVYAYTGDFAKGDINGDGKDGASRILLQPLAPLPPFVKVGVSDYGPIFTDTRGMTLYSVGNLAQILELFCKVDCMTANWTPVVPEAGAKASGNWSIGENQGVKQWYYRGEPVYLFKGDRKPSEIVGDRFAVGNGIRDGFHILEEKTLAEEAL